MKYGAFHLVTTTSAPAYVSGKTASRPALKYDTPKTPRFMVVGILSGLKQHSIVIFTSLQGYKSTQVERDT